MIHQDDEPTYEMVRKDCTAANEYITELESHLGPLICHFKNKRKSAHMDFALEKVLFHIDLQKWSQVIKDHNAYVQAHFARTDWKDMAGKFSVDGMRFDVLREDAEEWFALIYGKLQRKEGLVGISAGQVIHTPRRIGSQRGA
ncbi:MAG: hypothetical protein K0Q91_1903 [Fibrobacteria bacterium]|jgi:hypothetical protein|nr:hypothetical protein [Fibrobacteria bacterium]